jgi:predicted RecB family nuclease
MQLINDDFLLSATDLSKHLACRHATSLDLRAARGEIKKVYRNDPSLEVLEERGRRHEAAYIEHLKSQGHNILTAGSGLDRTVSAMKSGIGVIVQADLQHGQWRGRADILLKVANPSDLGSWSYEVIDTKLASETRGGTILQLCLYSELVAAIQGRMPDHTYVVSPGRNFQPETFRLNDFLAYYRFVKSRVATFVSASAPPSTYPEPVAHCDVCSWWTACNDRRRADDHLSFVAGITKHQIKDLRETGIETLAALAPSHQQARLQLEYRETRKPVFELLPAEPERGLSRLPEPCPGDIFLDFESDPFVEGGGLEYLLGYVTLNDDGHPEYTATWALDRTNERSIFERFIDMVLSRRKKYPDLHIYHYAPYEPVALKRLMGRYATREDELDRLLRAGVLVDLYSIVKQSLRASVEKYSLKDLELFFGFKRETELVDARAALRAMERGLELNDVDGIPSDARAAVAAYNREDCLATLHLRNWLEQLRPAGPRPPLEPGDPSEKVDEKRQRTLALMKRLIGDGPEDLSDGASKRSAEEQARWLLVHMLEFHRREEKAPWWEYYRLRELSDEELMEERSAISGLEFVKAVGGTKRCPIHRYRFPAQETQIRRDDKLEASKQKCGEVEAIDMMARTIDIKKTGAMAGIHPASVFSHTVITGGALEESLFRLGEWVADHGPDGIAAEGKYRAARDLLLRRERIDHVLPIQGPPGSGKTYTGARMICDCLRQGQKVGITAVSHKVIRKLLDETLKASDFPIQAIEKVRDESETPHASIVETTANNAVLDALVSSEATLAAGTGWLWARPEFEGSVDVLFVDEAGQMSLADVLAVSQAAKRIILLGDPQQLEQPLQGTHPPGVAVSALQHILGDADTMPPSRGQFLAETWRLAPAICDFTSEIFYDGRLKPHAGCELQTLVGPTRFAGSGLWFVPVNHDGNQNSSDEEASVVVEIVKELLASNVRWIDMHGAEHGLTAADILIVSPYNAQVFNLADRIPNVKIGTVDKFQGQEAPVVIYSMATSSPEDAPRGMEFLYSLNRFNVATSRARCAVILVANPKLFEPECQTPRQMKFANVLCRFLEMKQHV